MESKLVNELKLKRQPVAVILTNEKPASGIKFKEGSMGCVASMIVAASKGRTAFFDRDTSGCPGGGTGLGFGNKYGNFPIDCLLSTGNKEIAAQMGGVAGSMMAEGEGLYKGPELVRKWLETLPFTNVPTEYVVLKPFSEVTDQEEPKLIIFFVNGDQLSALVTMADYNRGTNQSIIAPYGAACQSVLFGYAEAEKDYPRAVIGFFDISQRQKVDRETMTITVPYKLFQEMEANVEGSFLQMHIWHKLQERQLD